jgi:DNA modification methylase
MDYQDFLETKTTKIESVGFDVPLEKLNSKLFDWQKVVTRWALNRGRAALFEDCGLGKSPQQLEWAHQVSMRTNSNVLILAPLAVAAQTVREGRKFGIEVHHTRTGIGDKNGVIITNYERLHYYNPSDYSGIVLDESSILKSFNGKTRKLLTDFSHTIKYRLACTATPAPNDLIEMTNHAEFLDIMTGKEIIALYFIQDGNTTHKWRLKGHAQEAYWKWMAQWAVAIRKPSDIGYDDGDFILPPLNIHNIEVDGHILDGELFQVEAQGLMERRQARAKSLSDRVKMAADIANGIDDPVLIWCDLNKESDMLKRAIEGAVEVKGSDDPEYKEQMLEGFATGEVKKLVSKPSIAGWGMNYQHCNKVIFVGLSDSYESYYQAVRRCWRFGQKRPVDVYVVSATTEGAVIKNIRRKEKQANEMYDNVIRHMKVYVNFDIQSKRDVMDYKQDTVKGEGYTLMLGDSCERIKEIESDSVGLSVFSPPFPGMYAYSNSPRDIGNVQSIPAMIEHFSFLSRELLRITMPGRNCAIHLSQVTAMKSRDGHIGLKDYRGATIDCMEEAGWRFAGEVTIDKNPQVQATRNKERGLLFKTLAMDSSKMRMALADYILLFRKDGDNPIPIRAGKSSRYDNDNGWITEAEWIEWAAPVWYRRIDKGDGSRAVEGYPAKYQITDGIMETDVLQFRSAKEKDDEKHLCPLQLGVIERVIKLWSAPGDIVFSPFGGIGSEPYQAIKLHRKVMAIELKESYFRVMVENTERAVKELNTVDMPLFAKNVV